MPTAVDHVEAALELLKPEDIAMLTPARRTRLSDALYAHHALIEAYVTGTAFPKVKRDQPKAGVLAQLKDGRSE